MFIHILHVVSIIIGIICVILSSLNASKEDNKENKRRSVIVSVGCVIMVLLISCMHFLTVKKESVQSFGF